MEEYRRNVERMDRGEWGKVKRRKVKERGKIEKVAPFQIYWST
jgi:hypothetical protein